MTIFCAHHKTGSTFLKKILTKIAAQNKFKLQIIDKKFKYISEIDKE